MPRILLMGFSKGTLGHIEGWTDPGSVVVFEEPDICRKKGVQALRANYSCLDEIVQVHYHQSEDFLAPALQSHEDMPFDCVIPGVEYAVPAAAAVSAKTGLLGASEAAAQTLRDKIRLREVTTRAGLPAPEWREVTGPEDIREFVSAGPAVLKPANRQASLGVQFLDRPEQADAAWESLASLDEPRQLPDRPLRWRYLVERRMTGAEYSVEALVRHGAVLFENITQKAVAHGGHPVEIGHIVPAPADPARSSQLVEQTRRLLAVIGFDTGIIHAEWIVTDAGPVLVECAGRIPGDHIIELIDLAYGSRLCHSLVDLLSGRPVHMPTAPARGAAIRFLSARPGTVTAIHGVRAVRARPDVEDVEVCVHPGDELRPWRSSWDRFGHVIASAETPPQASAAATVAAAAIDIQTVIGLSGDVGRS
jgi:biotin carboxylase